MKFGNALVFLVVSTRWQPWTTNHPFPSLCEAMSLFKRENLWPLEPYKRRWKSWKTLTWATMHLHGFIVSRAISANRGIQSVTSLMCECQFHLLRGGAVMLTYQCSGPLQEAGPGADAGRRVSGRGSAPRWSPGTSAHSGLHQSGRSGVWTLRVENQADVEMGKGTIRVSEGVTGCRCIMRCDKGWWWKCNVRTGRKVWSVESAHVQTFPVFSEGTAASKSTEWYLNRQTI